jgi:hypothetical protein
MSRLQTRLLSALAFVAVAFAQVFGVQRGYICDHGDHVVETGAQHCHRLVVDGYSREVPCEDHCSEHGEDKSERDEHQPLSLDVHAAPSSLEVYSVPGFVAVLPVEIWVQDWVEFQSLSEPDKTKAAPDTGGGNLPAALQVAHCTVLLV